MREMTTRGDFCLILTVCGFLLLLNLYITTFDKENIITHEVCKSVFIDGELTKEDCRDEIVSYDFKWWSYLAKIIAILMVVVGVFFGYRHWIVEMGS